MAKRVRKTTQEAEHAGAPAPPAGPGEAWRRVNRTQLAQLLGCHPETVTAWVRQGLPIETKGVNGTEHVFDAPACLKWWRETQGKVSAKDLEQTRQFKEAADAKALQNAVTRGKLVDADEVRRLGVHYTKSWSAQVRALPRRARQAGIVTGAEQEAQLEDLCRQVLSEIAGWKTAADVTRAAKDAAA